MICCDDWSQEWWEITWEATAGIQLWDDKSLKWDTGRRNREERVNCEGTYKKKFCLALYGAVECRSDFSAKERWEIEGTEGVYKLQIQSMDMIGHNLNQVNQH